MSKKHYKYRYEYMKSSFIREHLEDQVIDNAGDIRDKLESNSFVFLEDPIPLVVKVFGYEKTISLNRIGVVNIYAKDELESVNWEDITNRTLLEIFYRIKENKVFVYKRFSEDGKMMKCRIKKR